MTMELRSVNLNLIVNVWEMLGKGIFLLLSDGELKNVLLFINMLYHNQLQE